MKRLKSLVLTIPALLVSLQAHAQLPTPAFQFQSLVATGADIGGITLGSDVELKNFAVNDRGDVAMVVDDWPIPGQAGMAVITAKRIVAQVGDQIDGKTLDYIVAETLALDEQGSVAFEAEYEDLPRDGKLHTGVFHERHLEFEIRGQGTADDFTLADGKIIPNAALYQAPPSSGQPIAHSAPVRLSVLDDHRTPWVDYCNSPVFPTPANWPAGLKGPITNARTDGPHSYRSPFFGQENKAVRVSYFAGCPAPQVIVIADSEHPTHFEVWSAAGLVTYSDNGRMKTPGYDNPAVTGPITADVPPLLVTRNGQIAFAVSLDTYQGEDGFAVLLATHQ